jgi:hypothetical protein
MSFQCAGLVFLGVFCVSATAEDATVVIGDAGSGWRELRFDEFVNANGDDDTWTAEGGLIKCTGTPVGVLKSKQEFTNLELSLEWRHLAAGNSGVFLWAPPAVFENLPKGKLPGGGIEVQILDHGFRREGRLVHHQWRRVPGRLLDDEALPAALPQRQPEFSPGRAHQGQPRVEPLLRAGREWRGAALGQRPRSVWRQRLPARDRPPLPGI